MRTLSAPLIFIFVFLLNACFWPAMAADSTTGASPGASESTTTDSTGTTGAAAGGSAADCDFTAIKKSIEGTESSGKGCSTPGPMTKYGQAAGKYQFIPPTWNSMSKSCANSAQCPHASQAFYHDPVCCEVQECAMNNLLAANLAQSRKTANCQKILGKTISSPKYGSCVVTESGILAAFHLGGNDACDGPANGNYGDSDGHTTEADYICKHGGIAVPGNCTPPPYDPSIAQPVGTLQQLEVQTAQGDQPSAGPLDPLKEWWVAGLQMMAEQFTVNMVLQVEMLGTLLDAKHQLETQRLFQQKAAEAHKDYQPSEQMCTFGTFSKDLASTERTATIATAAIATELMQRELGSGETKSVTAVSDKMTRLSQFVKRFCNPDENGGGLRNLCPKNEAPAEMKNRDINYTQTIDAPLSLQINMTDTTTTNDEEAVFALVDNLFVHDPIMRIAPTDLELPQNKYHYMNMRSIIAMRGIARNSIANIIAMKSETPNKTAGTSAPYLKSLMQEFGLTPDEIKKYLGENPSYYAQMELLTKKVYQNPNFYAELYDTPTNVKRIRATMQAVKLMQDRDIQSALQRREMLLSVMLELRLRSKAEDVYNAAQGAMSER